MSDEAKDGKQECELVISYSVNYQGQHADEDAEYKRLQAALKDGCRVVDIISTASPGGGASSVSGFVTVTVLLEKPAAYGEAKYVRRKA